MSMIMTEEKKAEETVLSEKEQEEREDIIRRIQHTINKIRPYINQDGGDVQLIGYEDGIVTVSMLGACAGCAAIDTTLTEGIEALLIDEVPEVRKVELYPATPYPYYY